MAWRFKASKYKNAAPILPKPEACVRDVCVGSYQTFGNNITASAAFMAFNWEHTGSSVAVLPLDDCGRKSKTMPLLHGHTDTVTDMEFSPFHDGLLATASQDTLVKVWHIPEKGLETSLTEPECVFTHKQRRVETVGFHPTADCLLYSTAAGCVSLFDLSAQKELFSNNEHPDTIQSVSWRQDGTVMATSCKDKCVRIFDPRLNGTPIQMVADSHQSIKDSRVVWLGNQMRILTTGFDAARIRQVMIRDLRNFAVPEKILELDCSTGILMPLYDPDTNMLFLAGKGDTTINYLEVTDKEPYLIEGLRHTGEQTKGACLVPKRALKVMEAEVNRVLQLTSNMVIPIMYQVPRKTYRDFHADLYPETTGFKTELTANEWYNGSNATICKISLDPAKRELGDAPIIIQRGKLSDVIKNIENRKTHQLNTNIAGSVETAMQRKGSNTVGVLMGAGIAAGTAHKRNDNEQYGLRKSVQFVEKNGNASNGEEEMLTQKEIIRKFDNKCKIDATEKDAIMPIRAQHTVVKPIDDEEESPTEHSTGSSEEASSSAALESNTSSSGNSPPKPMPRTSRNNSLPDASVGGVVLAINPDSECGVPRPRPRTTAMPAYKPRLGPKPFTNNSTDICFDKVFAVPIAPGSQENINHIAMLGSTSHEKNATNAGTASDVIATSTVQQSAQLQTQPDKVDLLVEIEIRRNNEHDGANNANSSDNGIEKSLSTSERRKSSADDDDDSPDKIFEQNSESSENSIEGEDKTDADLRRFTNARNSIAERRRIYENRSKSTTEDKTSSPVPLRREVSKIAEPDNNKRISTSEDQQRRSTTSIGSLNMSSSGGVSASGDDGSSDATAAANGNANSVGIKKSATEVAITSGAVTKRTSTVFGRVSKFRHLKVTPGHKSTHIENLRNISRQVPGECNGFHANHERVAVPLAGPGGKIAVFELSRPGRLPDGVIPSLVNGSNIMDFQWNPFDPTCLAVACDDGIVKLWRIPKHGVTESIDIAELELIAHMDKIYFLRFHPLAANVLLTASYDMTIKLWNLNTITEESSLNGHTDQIFDYAWSPCGRYGATVCKDGKIRVFNPRKTEEPIREGNGPVGSRGARIIWALEGQYLVCTGFDKVSERQISVYNAHKLSTPLKILSIDVSPSILIPYYDEDSSTLFATGKGDSTIFCFEITNEEPYICALSHHRCPTLHQGLSFLTKNHCDVASVEFSKAYRLTNTTIEPLSFTVPRIKSEFFQDDLFPPTRVTWQPTLSSVEWFNMQEKTFIKISLQPEGMEALSSIQQMTLTNKKSEAVNSGQYMTKAEFERTQQQEIQKSVSARMEYNTKLEQDDMEGVDETEWQE